MTSKEMIEVAVKALDSRKGKDIRVLRTEEQTTLADYFVICNGTSGTQVRALADAVEEAMSKAGEEPHHTEGHRGGEWTLLDYSAMVVHVFTEEAREFYALERLWSDAEPVDVSGWLTRD
ncbi:MAG: ribosome silencing factor [Candidatus Enterenecus sp.]